MTTRPDGERRAVVVKLGGSTLGAHDTSLQDIAAAHRDGTPVVVVHGGGSTVSAWLERSGIAPRFVRGLRVTDAATLEVVVAVLAGVVNKRLAAELCALGAPAVGLSGADGAILQAHRYDEELGHVGRIHLVDPRPVEALLAAGYIPVVAPIAVEAGEGAPAGDGHLLNTNADTAAGEIAAAVGASQLVFLTDVPGVLDGEKRLIPRLTADEAQALVACGVAAGGMIPKIEAGVRAAAAGCATRIVGCESAGALADVLAGGDAGTVIGADGR